MPTTRERPSFRPRQGAGFRGLLVAALFSLPGVAAQAQFIRIGPFDFGATAEVEGIYTTNVDGVRPDATDKEMEDYYTVASFDLLSSISLFRNSTVDLSTGISIEKHARRDDLDTLSEPFGFGRIDTEFQFGRYTLRLNLANETSTATKEDTYTPSDIKKTRDVSNITDYGAELEWQRNDLSLIAGYNGSRERHRDDAFKAGDQDTAEVHASANWQFSKRLGFNYAYKRERIQLLNVEDSFDGWNEKNTVGLSFLLLERPHFTYTLGAEQSSVQDETIDWEPTHTFAVSDGLDLSRTLRLSGDVQYKYAQQLAADEVALTCNVRLDNEVSRTVRQTMSVTKEAANTFGSTAKTDVTSVDYTFTKQDLFVYNLTLALAAGYTYNKPMGDDMQSDAATETQGETQSDTVGDPEGVWKYSASMTHERALSRKLRRTLSYLYRHEKSNLEDEDLVEHRVTLAFTYTF